MKDTYWCISSRSDQRPADGEFALPASIFDKVRPGHGLVLASWLSAEMLGHVLGLGVVRGVSLTQRKADVLWRAADTYLCPNPQGRRHWANKEAFEFAPRVKERYMLADLFAEAFPDLDEIELGPFVRDPSVRPSKPNSYASDQPGFVYVVKSPYGYKIGKTLHIKDRIGLFAVKLPFKIDIEHYAHFPRYSEAERSFHLKFAQKRLEGEWFDLSTADLAFIKAQGEPVP